MTRTIYKVPVTQTNSSTVKMPWPFTILAVQSQNNGLYLWAEVEPENTVMVTRTIEVYGTGWQIESHPEPKRYIGTAQAESGAFVWHVFERGDGVVGKA